jgi:hypothetical protein
MASPTSRHRRHHGIAGITASLASRHCWHHGIAGITALLAFSPVYIQGSFKIVFSLNPNQHAQHTHIVQFLDMYNLYTVQVLDMTNFWTVQVLDVCLIFGHCPILGHERFLSFFAKNDSVAFFLKN